MYITIRESFISSPIRRAAIVFSLLLLASCVTINVYFPAAAAEKAADRIIDQVLGEDSQQKQSDEAQSTKDKKTSYSAPDAVQGMLVGLLNVLVSDAHASANIDISSPAINQLKSSMQARHTQLSPFYKSGAIGYSAKGLVAVRDIKAVGLRDRGKLKKLVAQENQDRNKLYQEIANANGHPEWEAQIRSTFARRWIARAPLGWYYQNSSGAWKQK